MKPRILIGAFVLFLALPAFAVDESDSGESSKGGPTLPIPRFASLKASDVNLRTGPGTRYPIEWVFTHQGMPVEITAEYEMWRKVRDVEGDEGWVHRNALSGKRTAIITGTTRELREDNDDRANIVAHLQPGAIGQLVSCTKDWCKLKFKGGVKGYLRKPDFWGAYDAETLK